MLEDVGRKIQSAVSTLVPTSTDAQVEACLKDVCNALLHSNVPPKQILSLRSALQTKLNATPRGISKAKAVHGHLLEGISELLDPGVPAFHPQKGQKTVVMFVGLQGSGKTTTVAKYAALHSKEGFKVGVVCADTFRPGALHQVRMHCLRLKVPFYGSDCPDPCTVVAAGLKKLAFCDLILVDTSGRAGTDAELLREMRDVHAVCRPTAVLLVVDAGIGVGAEAQALGFSKAIPISSIVLSKADCARKAGGALASIAAAKAPIAFVGVGEDQVDLRRFDPIKFARTLLGLGDIQGLHEKLSSLDIDEKKIAKKALDGTLTMRDFYNQFVQLQKLGPLSAVLSMLPGNLSNAVDDSILGKMLCIFDSLSKNELDSDGSMFENSPERIQRVARGSGNSVETVKAMLVQFREIAKMMKKFAGMPGLGKDPSSMSLAEKTRMRSQMKSLLPKNMYDQMSQLFQ